MSRTNKRVSAIITRGNNLLLIHRKKYGKEYWVVPGGGVEDGESVEKGLIREVKEETGFDVLKPKFIGGNKEGEIEHYFYACDVTDGEPVLGGPEAEDRSEENWFHLEWVERERILSLNLYPAKIKDLIDQIF